MALSRLRHQVISRSPSLFKARLLSSSFPNCRSLICNPCRVNSLLDGDGNILRNGSLSMVTRVHDCSSGGKLQTGVRCFSSQGLPSHMVIGMPALSPTMTQGNIAKWRKKEGDKIEVGDILCDIETDKATLEFECLEEGFLAKILVPEGSKDVSVGQPIAITVEDAEEIQNVPVGDAEEKSAHQSVKSEDRVQEVRSVKLSISELPHHIVLEMPALSPTMNQGNITKWRKKEGDKIEVGDVICEIETDKATLEYECLEEGYLAKILASEGSKDVAVGQPIAITVENLNDIEAVKNGIGAGGGPEVQNDKTDHDSRVEIKTHKANFNRISPSAKMLIAEFGLDKSSLRATGPRGTLLKGDVLAAIKSGKVSRKSKDNIPLPQAHPQTNPSASLGLNVHLQRPDSFEDLPNSQIRKVIAKRLLESKQNTPHLYLSSDVILDPLLSFRKELLEKHGVKVSVNDIVIKVVAIALRNVPEANGYWNTDKGDVTLCDSIDISIAVATEKGLMTPIIRNADQKSISSISFEVKELAEKARLGKLSPNEFQGGSFSISNLGMFPVDRFCAIINPPQACILAVGRGNKVVEPVVGSNGLDEPAVVTKMNLTLSADHRVFDGKVGGAFLSALCLNFCDIRRLIL